MWKTPDTANLQIFSFNEKESTPIRVQVIDNEPWFVAKDVCRVLGIANHKDAVSRVDDDERRGVGITDPLGGRQQATAVNESGLYHLIFQSRKPEAKKFRKWVTNEVLPSIRKTGGYKVAGRKRNAYLDWRDRPYRRVKWRNGDVRMVKDGAERWFSVNDLLRCLGSRTESSQSAHRLGMRGDDLVRKILLYGMTQPGWFVRTLGAELLACGSLKGRISVQLELEFK